MLVRARTRRESSIAIEMRGALLGAAEPSAATLAARSAFADSVIDCIGTSFFLGKAATITPRASLHHQLIFLRKRYLIQIATPFMSKVIASRIAPAAAALAWNAWSGLETQL